MKRAPAQTVKLGLIQTACSANPDANLKKTLALADRGSNASELTGRFGERRHGAAHLCPR